jgi:four helix bundle protein
MVVVRTSAQVAGGWGCPFIQVGGADMNHALFDHDRLDVYQVARRFKRQLKDLFLCIPRGNANLLDQLKRGARSITSNIAEGSGKWSTRDKVHYMHIARGSATECAAILDECVDYELLLDEQVRPALETLSRVVAMLVKMILSLEKRGAEDMRPRPRKQSVEAPAPDGTPKPWKTP